MKQIIVTMDHNGHMDSPKYAGVIGDHNAAILHIAFEEPSSQINFYRLLFAGEKGSKITEQLFYNAGSIRYTLPEEVTALGSTIFCQLCGYNMIDETVNQLFKSDTFTLNFGSELTSTDQLDSSPLSDKLMKALNQLEQFHLDMNFSVGRVTAVDADKPAQVRLHKNGYQYTLDFDIPKGETVPVTGNNGIIAQNNIIQPDFNIVQQKLTAGNGISLEGNVLSIAEPPLYQAVANSYFHLGIESNSTVPQLAGNLIFVNPRYSNTSRTASFFTRSQGVYYRIYHFEGTKLVAEIPIGSIVPGRLMAIYIDEENRPIYLNPYLTDTTPLTVTPDYKENEPDGIPCLNFSTENYNPFIGGKIITTIATQDIRFNNINWQGPLSCAIQYFNGTGWTNIAELDGGTIYTGQSVALFVDYNPDNNEFRTIRLLNPPIQPTSTWESVEVETLATSYSHVNMHYKRTGDTVTIRFTGNTSSNVTSPVLLGKLPAQYCPTYADEYDGMTFQTTNNDQNNLLFTIFPNGNIILNADSTSHTMSSNGWISTYLTFTV